MESTHVVILRKNLVYLKEHLEVGEVLDHLYQEGIFTQPEYHRCRQAGPDKCGPALETLMRKGEDGYKSLCAVLDRSQPHVKQQLDSTSSEEGATSLLFVNKLKLEQQHREAIVKKEKIVTNLQDEICTLRGELEAAKTAREEDRERHLAELGEEKKKYELNLEKEREKQENVKEQVEEWEGKAKHFEEKAVQLRNALSDEMERYEAIAGLKELKEPENDERTEITGNSDACVFSDDSVCDESQLMLLPCLHAACKPCIDHHTDQADQGRLLCPCGREIEIKVEDLPADFTRRNEAAYNASRDKKNICTYKDHEHEKDAATYCQDCDDYFCLECQNNHDEVRKNRSHRRTEIPKMDTITIQKWLKEKTCQDHPKQEILLYDNTCKKPVCLLCSKGSHKQHDVEDLYFVHKKTTTALEEMIKNHQCKLDAIRELANAVEEHQASLHQAADDLETQVVSVHQDVAGKFLHRQKQLIQDIRLSLEGPNQAVQEKLKTVRAAEKSGNSTIDYIQRAMESTTKAELISLSDAVLKKSAEHLKTELPTDDTRDTRVRLSFQGQKALEEIIDVFGSLATCTQMEDFADIQPTVKDLRREMNELTERLTLIGTELQEARETITVDEVKIKRLQFVCSFLEQGIPIYIVTIAEREDVASNFVSCPPMTYSKERVCWELDVSEDGQKLVSWRQSGRRHQSDQFQKYVGTCSHLPISLPPSPSTLTAPRYWETNTRVQLKWKVSMLPLLEMGVSEEGWVDTRLCDSEQSRFWAVRVSYCNKHQGCCTKVWGEGRHFGVCQTDTLTNTRGTDVTLRYGCVLDVGRGRLAFIDVDREIVLHKFHVRFTQPLFPMFGVWPFKELYTIKMRLVSGGDINMTDRKKALIFTALS